METPPVVEVNGLSFTYEGRDRPAIRDIDFRLGHGQSLLVLGPSGSGKSTLALCLDGLIPQVVDGDYHGTVAVAGLVASEKPVHVIATQVGLVFQDPEAQFCTLTVGDEVAFGLENLCVPSEQIESRVREALATVGLSGMEERPLSRLSGGEKQRVALASVLAMRPPVIVLDEPSANLDPAASQEFFNLLRSLHRTRKHTLVLVEHRLDEVVDWIDEVLVLSAEGSMLASGQPRQVFYDEGERLASEGVWMPRTVQLAELLGQAGLLVPGSPLTIPEMVASLRETSWWPKRFFERSMSQQLDERLRAVGVPFFEVRNLSYRYLDSGPLVLSNVDLTICAGEFAAIVGANGAGKTTLATLLSGIREAPSGCVLVQGRDIGTYSARGLSTLVGHVFQNPEHQFVSERVIDEVAVGLALAFGRRWWGRRLRDSRLREEALEWLRRFGLEQQAYDNPYTLSQGQKRRLSVAAMMACGQQALILDEPTFGQDQKQSQRLLETLTELNRLGVTVIVVTHDMDLVAEYADRVLVLDGGNLVFDGMPGALFEDEVATTRWGLVPPVIGQLCAALRAEGLWTPRRVERLSPEAFARVVIEACGAGRARSAAR